jgi:hypothetical protein
MLRFGFLALRLRARIANSVCGSGKAIGDGWVDWYSFPPFGLCRCGWVPFHPSPTSAKGSLRSPGLRILSHKGRGRLAAPCRLAATSSSGDAVRRIYLSPCGRGYEGRVSKAKPWPKLVRGEIVASQDSKHTSAFTRAFPPRGLTMHVSRSPCFRMKDRPGHEIVPQLVTGVDRSLRHASVPRSVVFPVQLRSLCVIGCLGNGDACSASTPAM